MNVVFLTAAPPDVQCGIGNYTRTLARAVRDLGVSATIVSGLSAQDRVTPPGGSHERPIVDSWSLSAVPRIRRELLRLSPDVVHLQFPGRGFARSLAPNVLPWALRSGRGPHVVTTLHEFGTASALGKARILFGAWRSECVIVPDDATLRELRATLARLPLAPPVVVIPIASDVPVADSADRAGSRERFRIPEGVLAIGWFGLLSRDKGADLLARALPRVAAQRAVILVLIGDLGDLPERRSLIDALRERVPVVETGVLSPGDTARALASVDVVALPYAAGVSERRSSYLAAAAQGAFVVTTSAQRRGYAPDVNTAFVPIGNEAALSTALVDPKPRALPVPPAAAWDAIARAHVDLYRDLAAR